MKTIFRIMQISVIISSSLFAQWEEVYTNNLWANGATIYLHKNVLFQTGYSNVSNQTLRSDDNGLTWTNISSSFPTDLVLNIVSFGNSVFAVMPTSIGQTRYSFYESIDEGITWTEKSIIDRGSGNGAILSMTSDGSNLFAVSNKRSIYKSIDGGSSWTELIINYSGTSSILSFAASGSTYIAALEGVGSIVSTDSGLNWAKNSSATISEIYKLNNDVWGIGAGFSGIYKFNTTSDMWENNFLPGTFSMPVSIGANETQLISSFGDFLTLNRYYYTSNDNGLSWNELTTETIGLNNNITSRRAVTANDSYYFAGYWKSTNGVITYSVFRLPISITSVTSENIKPDDFILNQNYPNPFNPSTTISYSLVKETNVKIIIFDMLGREVAVPVNEFKTAGEYNFTFNAADLASGIYYYTITAGNFSDSKKMVLLR